MRKEIKICFSRLFMRCSTKLNSCRVLIGKSKINFHIFPRINNWGSEYFFHLFWCMTIVSNFVKILSHVLILVISLIDTTSKDTRKSVGWFSLYTAGVVRLWMRWMLRDGGRRKAEKCLNSWSTYCSRWCTVCNTVYRKSRSSLCAKYQWTLYLVSCVFLRQ